MADAGRSGPEAGGTFAWLSTRGPTERDRRPFTGNGLVTWTVSLKTAGRGLAGMAFETVPDGWRVWTDGEEKAVLVYRPDVFDTDAFPAPCLPTIYVTKGKRSRHPGSVTRPDDPWHVTLFLEPDVNRDAESFDTREAAEDAARELARRFDAGDVDYRGLYQVPREDYFDELDALTGPE